jgi:hypothetical protein
VSGRFGFLRVHSVVLAGFAAFLAGPAPAGAVTQEEMLRNLPDVSRVLADYRDDAERVYVLNILMGQIANSFRKPWSPQLEERFRRYGQARDEIEAKYKALPPGSSVARAYRARYDQMAYDYKRQFPVLERYGLYQAMKPSPLARVPGQQRLLRSFPEPSRVLADFADGVERRVALFHLYNALDSRTNQPRDPAVSQRLEDYHQASLAIERGLPLSEHYNFSTRAKQLNSNSKFEHAILARYGLLQEEIALTFSDGGLIALVAWCLIATLIIILGAPRSSIQRRHDVSGRVVFDVNPSPSSFTFMVVTAAGFLCLTIIVAVISALIGAIVAGLLRGPNHPSVGKFAAYGAILGVVTGIGVLAPYCWVKFFRIVFRSERCRKPVTLTVDDRGLSKDGRLYPVSDPAALRTQSAEALGRAQWSGDTVIVVGTGWVGAAAAATSQAQVALARAGSKFGDWARERQESRSYMVTLQTKESNQIAVLAGGLSASCASSLKRDLAAALAKAERPGATNAPSGNGAEAHLGAKVRPAGTPFGSSWRYRCCPSFFLVRTSCLSGPSPSPPPCSFSSVSPAPKSFAPGCWREAVRLEPDH